MRKLLTGLVLAGSLAFAGTAAADQPVMFSDSATQSTPVPNISCKPFGYAFGTLATFHVERSYTQFYDGATLVKEIRHVKFDGTLYRSDDLSKTIPYAGTWTRIWYPLENLVVNTGLFRYSHPDGSGMVTLDAGRTEQVGSPPFTILSDTGPTQVEWQQAVCAYLAEA
jgi:hypothetical protein